MDFMSNYANIYDWTSGITKFICFDELYNYEGWSVGEFKALTETFEENEYIYKCFSNNGAQVVIEYKNNKNS